MTADESASEESASEESKSADPASADPASADPASRLEETLRGHGISVESVDAGDPLEITYMTAFPGREVHRKEIGRALNALIDRVEADAWDPVRVEATVVRAPGDPLGEWAAEGAWFEALVAGEISETEFSGRVLDTLTHVDGSDDTGDPEA